MLMHKDHSRSKSLHRGTAWVMTLAMTLGLAQNAWAWATPEHIQFGHLIAKPFEKLMKAPLPVIKAPSEHETYEALGGVMVAPGPENFGDYVAAPDFARGLTKLLQQKASTVLTTVDLTDAIDVVDDDHHCGRFFNREGLGPDGKPIDDQSHAGQSKKAASAMEKVHPGWADCVNGWRVNNSHFGDFSANHYAYYHKQALVAARRYRLTRQPACREAAYTLEGWGQHFLTDSVAAGHAWNPPGSYSKSFGWQSIESTTVRMRIHDFLNNLGVKMNDSWYQLGTFWGDHSEQHTASGLMISEQPQGGLQREAVLRLSRMGLGQVVAVAECGGQANAEDVMVSRHEAADVRRAYASDEAMCEALWDHELADRWWIPESVVDPDLWGLDIAEVKQAALQCKKDKRKGQALSTGQEQAWLARYYFPDKRWLQSDTEVDPAIDPEALVALEDLGCGEVLPVLPLTQPDQRDLCGSLLCETPQTAEGSCPQGMLEVGQCCHKAAMNANTAAAGQGQATSWSAHQTPVMALGAQGAVPGGAAEFVWFADDVSLPAMSDFVALPRSVTLGGGPQAPQVDACVGQAPSPKDVLTSGRGASYSVYEARATLPPVTEAGTPVLVLTVEEMDEGLKVQVNGQLVRFVKRDDGLPKDESGQVMRDAQGQPVSGPFSPIQIALASSMAPASADGSHVVRLTHLNSCGAERPLKVTLSSAIKTGKGDLVAFEETGGGCSVPGSGGSPPSGLLLLGLLGLALVSLRRSR